MRSMSSRATRAIWRYFPARGRSAFVTVVWQQD
jgi:hypothetical protein